MHMRSDSDNKKMANSTERLPKSDHVLPQNFGGGPHGLGDPNDKQLRKVEKEIMIPKKMRDIAKEEKCVDVVKPFKQCCKASGLLMVVRCREENAALKACLTSWYENAEFRKKCTDEYLEERTRYRATGIKAKEEMKKVEPSTF